MEYVLVHLRKNGEDRDEVTFRVDNQLNTSQIERFTQRVVVKVLQTLNEAEQADPSKRYLPMAPIPLENGAEIRVLNDAFVMLEPDFVTIVQGLLDEFMEYQVRKSKYAQ